MEKSPKPIETHRFCVLPPLKNHPPKAIGFVYSPLWKLAHQNPSVLCTPPFENSPTKTHRFCVLSPMKNHPPKVIGFMYSPLWKLAHQSPLVSCTRVSLWKLTVFGRRVFGVGVYFGKYGMFSKVKTYDSNRVFVLFLCTVCLFEPWLVELIVSMISVPPIGSFFCRYALASPANRDDGKNVKWKKNRWNSAFF